MKGWHWKGLGMGRNGAGQVHRGEVIMLDRGKDRKGSFWTGFMSGRAGAGHVYGLQFMVLDGCKKRRGC